MPIRVLPLTVAARIAAGEVVERPASVAKELLENALDAGARSVSVEVAGGGVELLRVADDGAGVPAAEVPLAFARHATSKLADLADLDRLTTLGFRGEALPSIAAVAEVSFLTRPADAPAATLLRLAYGAVVEQRAAARAPGTTITVERLFGQLPARRKFLKARSTEAGHVAHVVTQLALGRPDVRFDLRVDGRPVLSTPGRGDAREALAAVYGPAAARAMLALPEPPQTGGVNDALSTQHSALGAQPPALVRGYVSPPALHRGTRGGLTLFVNGRVVYSRTLLYAVEEAYHTLLPVGRHPLALLWIDVPPDEVDVNVHPTKQEVRFLRERAVFAALQRAVRAVVAEAAGVPLLAGAGRAAPAPPLAPAAHGPLAVPAAPDDAQPRGLWDAADLAATDSLSTPHAALSTSPRLAQLRVLGQVAMTYITAEGDAGLYLVDQHAAHERVLLEQLRRNAARRDRIQYLLEPQSVELSPAQAEALRDRGADLGELGFVVEDFGPRTLLLRAIPAALKPTTIARVLQETFEALAAEATERGAAHAADDPDAADWRERLSLLLACKTAVKAGQLLSHEEMRALLEQLDEAELGRTCAHGRPTAVLLTHGQLEREFGRR
ncbi:MAG TPA: DNA mismatch repair endonuclease MutL [Chloroflexota bacterium]|nr:DNA mismatch repair endonuclease MutL [Chloroflexota bacterium]